jgi:hypothetical protein
LRFCKTEIFLHRALDNGESICLRSTLICPSGLVIAKSESDEAIQLSFSLRQSWIASLRSQ